MCYSTEKSCPFCKDFAALTAEHPTKIEELVDMAKEHDKDPETYHKNVVAHMRRLNESQDNWKKVNRALLLKLYDEEGCIYCRVSDVFKKQKLPTHKHLEAYRSAHHEALNTNPVFQKMSQEQKNEQLAAVEHDVKIFEIHSRKPDEVHDMIDYKKGIYRGKKPDEKNAATMAVSSPKTGETCNCETGDHANSGGQEHGMFNQDIGRQNWQGQGLPQPVQDKDNCQCDEKPAEANKVPNADARLGDNEDEKKKSYCQCNKAYDAEGKELKVVVPLHAARPTGGKSGKDFLPNAAEIDEKVAEHYGEIPRSHVGGRHNAPPKKQSKGDKFMSRHMSPEALQHHEMTTYDPDLAEKLTAVIQKASCPWCKENAEHLKEIRDHIDGMAVSAQQKTDMHEMVNEGQLSHDENPDKAHESFARHVGYGKVPDKGKFVFGLGKYKKLDKAEDDEPITGTSTGAKKTPNPKKYLHKPSEHNPMGVINPQWTDWRAARRKQLKEGKRETDSKKLLENMSADTKLNLQTQAKLISAGTQSINDQKRAEQNKKRKPMTRGALAARRKRLLGKAILRIKAMIESLKVEENQFGAWGQRGLGEGENSTDIQGSGDTHLISPVKQEELDKLMAGARYLPRSVSRKKPDMYQ